MTLDEWSQINEIFHQAHQVETEHREEFVNRACQGNERLNDLVVELLEEDERMRELMPTPESDPEPGIILKNRYRLEALLGRGAFGYVYIATHLGLRKSVAVKVLHWDRSSNPVVLRLFREEAEKASSLDHPGIVTIHDIDEDQGFHFIVMEFVEGETLKQMIARGPIGLERITQIAVEICDALTITHRANIVHQDIKPENIMIRKADSHIKILDFGIAYLAAPPSTPEGDTLPERETPPEMLRQAGTPAYMSPEKWEGLLPDGRSDIFSVGVVLYEMMTARRPFSGHTRDDWRRAICHNQPDPLESGRQRFSPRWKAIVAKSLAKNRDERYQSIEELRRDIENTRRWPVWAKVAAVSMIALLSIYAAHRIIEYYREHYKPPPPVSVTELVNRNITDGGRIVMGSFSPDSRTIAYSTSSDEGNYIWWVNMSGGESVKLVVRNWKDRNPVWSPNAQDPKIAFLSSRNGRTEVWEIAVPGVTPRPLGEIDDGAATLIKWSSREDAIYYESRRNLYRFDVHSGKSSPLTFNASGTSATNYDISQDEQLISYLSLVDGKWRIFVKAIKGGEARQVAGVEGDIRSPRWFPDNTSIAYVANKNGVFQLFEAFLSGDTPRRVSTDQNNYDWVSISPDGTTMIACSGVETASIFGSNIQSAGSEKTIVTEYGLHLYPVDSPRGDRILFQSSGSNMTSDYSIYTKSVGDSSPRLTVGEGFDAKWSPQGTRIAFLRRSTAGFSLQTIGTDGGTIKELVKEGVGITGQTYAPYYRDGVNYNWSYDGTRIAYTSSRSGAQNIWVVSEGDSRDDTMRTSNNDPQVRIDSPFWSPDDKRLAYVVGPKVATALAVRSLNVLEDENPTIVLRRSLPLRMLGWSDKGDFLYFVEGELKLPSPAQHVKLFRVPARGGEPHPVGEHPAAYVDSGCLSRDGKWIAFVAQIARCDNLFVVGTRGGPRRQVTNNSDPTIFFSGVSWSADQKTLYFSKQLGWTRIWRIGNL